MKLMCAFLNYLCFNPFLFSAELGGGYILIIPSPKLLVWCLWYLLPQPPLTTFSLHSESFHNPMVPATLYVEFFFVLFSVWWLLLIFQDWDPISLPVSSLLQPRRQNVSIPFVGLLLCKSKCNALMHGNYLWIWLSPAWVMSLSGAGDISPSLIPSLSDVVLHKYWLMSPGMNGAFRGSDEPEKWDSQSPLMICHG